MKRLALTTVSLLFAFAFANAQYKMVVETNDGLFTNYWTTDIKSIIWQYFEPDEPQNDDEETTVTGLAQDITNYTVTITSWANILDNLSTDLKVGIIYCTYGTPSKSNGTQKTVSTGSIGADAKYTVQITDLAPSTTYYYRSFVYQSGIWFYGNVKSFTTKSQGVNLVTGETGKLTCYSAKASGAVSIDSDTKYSSLSYGICFGTTQEPSVNDTRLQASNKDSDGNFTCQLRALEGNTTYYYRSYAYVDSYLSYGPIRSFTTREDDVVITGDIDATTYTVISELRIGAGAYSTLQLGVCYGTGELPTVSDRTVTSNEVDDENKFALTLSNVPYGTIYYRSYVMIDGVAHYGVVKSCEYRCPVPEPDSYVDLGLSVKWATCNVGATKPEEYGDYFAWGATEPWYRTGYAQSATPEWKTGKSDGYTKANTPYSVINEVTGTYQWTKYLGSTTSEYKHPSATDADALKKVLDLEDDAARANWGGDWRMPTIAEFQELEDNCTWTWYGTGNTEFGGVAGYKVTGKKSGYEGSFIFLPAAGCCHDTNLDDAGSNGYYWSSSLYERYPDYARFLYFYSGFRSNYSYRYHGGSVRPVHPCAATSVSLNRTTVEVMSGGWTALTATVVFENGATSTAGATWSSNNTSVATVDGTGVVTAVSLGECTVTATCGGISATCTVTVKPFEPECVDLGLSVKWATCNVGASSPEKYGDYFAWGATEPWYQPGYAQAETPEWKTGKLDGYTFVNAPYQTVNTTSYSSTKWTKYLGSTTSTYKDVSATDADALKTVLDLSDDAARANWGDDWRMPTIAEFQELEDNCTWTWTTMNGKNGYKVVSKLNGNFIFLPAAGRRYDTSLDDTSLVGAGSGGYYWSSSLSESSPYCARTPCFDLFRRDMNHGSRYYGHSVRPVRK